MPVRSVSVRQNDMTLATELTIRFDRELYESDVTAIVRVLAADPDAVKVDGGIMAGARL
jgi:hypothetical protein